MFGKIARWLGKAMLVVMAGLGLLAVVVVWQLADFFKGWGDKPKSEPVQVVQTKEPAQAVEAAPCLCSAGAECTGPKGGLYCLTDDGKKKYKGKP